MKRHQITVAPLKFILALAAVAPAAAWSQQSSEESGESTPVAEDIVVTATKGAKGTSVQETPLAVSAFGAAQLESQHLASVSELTTVVPNVNLNSTTTFPGFSNFTIRGMAVYSTIPSTTPTVGVFIDGVYQGTPMGAGWNSFDLAGIEVLRGPQGLFFGRNVTAGAILVRTTDPSEKFGLTAQAGMETGPAYTLASVVTGPISSTLSGKLGVYYNKDEGYFNDPAVGRDIGRSRSIIARGALAYRGNGGVEAIVRFEHGDLEGDGVVNQNHVALPGKRFDVQQGNPGYVDARWWQLSSELTVDVGAGKIFNIAAVRDVDSVSVADVDGTPRQIYDLYNSVKHTQFSNELRFAGEFSNLDISAGVFAFADKLKYIEDRVLQLGTTLRRGGGYQQSQTLAQFANVDWHITDSITLNIGERYSVEWKQADIQPLVATATSPCSTATRSCSLFRYPNNKKHWSAFTPRLGVQWEPSSDTNLYGFFTKGFRSGGYNLRNATGQAATPYDQEVEDTFEIGIKQRLFDRRLTINLTAFQNTYKKLQRDLQLVDPVLGTIQFTANAANVRIQGIEGEFTADIGGGFSLGGNFGYLHDKFTKILFDLSANGVVGPEDYRLQLPFKSPWSYGASVDYRTALGNVDLSARLAFSHRDTAASNDPNSRFLPAVDTLDANLSAGFGDGRYEFSVYGKNLLDRVNYTYNNPLRFVLPDTSVVTSTFSPIAKGRIIGAKIRFKY